MDRKVRPYNLSQIMKLELIGKRYSLILMGVKDSRVLKGGSDYYSSDELHVWWKGTGIIQGIDGSHPRAFTFSTKSGGDSFEDSVLRMTYKDGGYFSSSPVIKSERLADKEGFIDFFAQKILDIIDDKEDVSIPIPTHDELMEAGVITDWDGNALLPLASQS